MGLGALGSAGSLRIGLPTQPLIPTLKKNYLKITQIIDVTREWCFFIFFLRAQDYVRRLPPGQISLKVTFKNRVTVVESQMSHITVGIQNYTMSKKICYENLI